jgi:hypothetical protein
MKTITPCIVFLFLFLSLQTISAQFGNNGMMGNRGMNGMNQMGSMNQRSQPAEPKVVPPEESVAEFMVDLKPALQLDELQVIAISNVMVESLKTQGRISKLNIPEEDRLNEYKLLGETADKNIASYLNKEQKELYVTFKENKKNGKKVKDKVKKKDKKE